MDLHGAVMKDALCRQHAPCRAADLPFARAEQGLQAAKIEKKKTF